MNELKNKENDRPIKYNKDGLKKISVKKKVKDNINNLVDKENQYDDPIDQIGDVPIIRYIDRNNKIVLRKKQLFDHLSENKLEYISNGICDQYIKYGKPSLENVVDDIQNKTDRQTKRLLKLLKKLEKENEQYDPNNSYYQQYVKNGGNLDEIINEGIKEWFYVHKTNYPELLEIYKDEDKAQAQAFNNYVKQYGTDRYTERIRKSEMTVVLYY